MIFIMEDIGLITITGHQQKMASKPLIFIAILIAVPVIPPKKLVIK